MKNKKVRVVVMASIIAVTVITITVFMRMFSRQLHLSEQQTSYDQSVARTPFSESIQSPIDRKEIPDRKLNETTTGWQTYRNEEHGFEFKYPETWRYAEGTNFFLIDPGVNVLQFDLKQVNPAVTVDDFVANFIKEHNCESLDNLASGDHIIERKGNGIYYVEFCSATSETYHYAIKLTGALILDFSYQDDFDPEWTESEKLTVFKQIISTLR